MKHPSLRHPVLCSLAFAALLGLGAGAARAATYTWDGGGANGNWSTAANWLTDVVPPSNSDTALVFAGSAQLSSPQNIAAAFTINRLLFDPTAGAFVLGGGRIDFFPGSTGTAPALTQNSASPVVINNAMRLNALISIGGTGNLTLAGTFDNNAGIVKVGPGTLTLSGSNNFTPPGLTLQQGVVNVASAGALGNGGTLTFTGGTLQYSSANAVDYSLRFATVANQAYSIDTNGQNVTFAAALTSSGGSLTKLGAGSLTLSAANTFAGGAAFSGANAGTLLLANRYALQNSTLTTSGGAVVFDAGVANGLFTVGGLAGTGNLALVTNAATPTGVSLEVGNNNADTTFAGALSGAGGLLSKIGTGTLTLTGANTYSSSTQVIAGTLAVGAGGSTASGYVGIGAGGTLTISGGSVTANNGGFNVGTTTGTALAAANLTGGTLTASGLAVGAFGSSNAAFTQSGGTASAGALYLGFSSGDTGTYNLSNTGSLSTGTAYVGYNGVGTFTQTGGTFTTGNATLNIGFNANTQPSTYTLNAGTLTTGSTLVSDDANTAIFTQAGGTHTTGGLILTGYSALSTGIYNLNGGTLSASRVYNGVTNTNSASLFNFNGGTLRPTANTTNFMQGLTRASVQAGGARIDTNGFNITIAQPLVHDATVGAPAIDGGLTKLGAGTLTLSGANTFTGPLAINAGTLAAASEGNLGAGSAVTLTGTGQLLFTGSPTLTRTYNLGFGTLAAAAGTTLTFGGGAAVNGGFLGRLGTDAFTDGSSLNAASTTIGSALTTSGAVAFTNDTLRGSVVQAGTLNLTNTVVSSAGSLTVNGTVVAAGLENDGVLTVNGTLNAGGGAPLALGGGSRTTINAPG